MLSRAGTKPQALLGAFMLTAGFLSAWISNTAATVMMLPIALSVIAIVKSDDFAEFRAARAEEREPNYRGS